MSPALLWVQTMAVLLLTFNPDFTELKLRCCFLPVGWGSPALTFWSREEGWVLPSALLSSFLYLHNLAENQDFSQRGRLQRAGWAAAACHLGVRLQPSNPWWAQTRRSCSCGIPGNAGAWCQQLHVAPGRLFRDTAGALIWGLLGIQIQMSCFVDKHRPDLLLCWGVLMERKGFQQWLMLQGWKSLKGRISSFSSAFFLSEEKLMPGISIFKGKWLWNRAVTQKGWVFLTFLPSSPHVLGKCCCISLLWIVLSLANPADPGSWPCSEF